MVSPGIRVPTYPGSVLSFDSHEKIKAPCPWRKEGRQGPCESIVVGPKGFQSVQLLESGRLGPSQGIPIEDEFLRDSVFVVTTPHGVSRFGTGRKSIIPCTNIVGTQVFDFPGGTRRRKAEDGEYI